MQDPYDDDPWLTYSTTVPDRLRPLLRQYGNVSNLNLGHAIASELGLPTDRLGVAACQVMLKMLRPLADVVDGRDRVADPATIAYDATEGLDVDDVRDALRGFGGGRLRMNSAVDFWDVDARKLLADYLTPNLSQMLTRWSSRTAAPLRRRSRSDVRR